MLDKELELAKLDNISTLEDLEAWYQAILGKKGQLSEQLKALATMTPEEKKEKGWLLSAMRTSFQEAYQAKFDQLKIREINEQLSLDLVDISLPGIEPEKWHYSLLTKVRRELEEIAHGMGFIVENGKDGHDMLLLIKK